MSKKIYVNATILHERPTGLGVYAKSILKYWAREKRSVEVFSPVEVEGLKTHEVTKYVKPSYKKKGGLIRLLYTQLILPFKVKKEDILYHPFQYLSLLSRSKQIITIHDFIPLHYPEVAKHQYRYYKYLMPLLLKKAHKIICISNTTKEDLLKIYKVDESKVYMVHNGYDEELFNTENINGEILKKYSIDYEYMVMVGASYPHKNLDSAIKAFKELRDRKGCKLVIIGKSSPYIEKLKVLAEELEIKEEVVFLGYVGDEDLKTLYNKAKAFVYPTLYEGFGLPILEAVACDTLVLCSNNSSLPEVYGEDGESVISFNPESVEEIKTAMERVLEEDPAIEDIKRKGRENLKRFSWKKTAEEVYEIIKE